MSDGEYVGRITLKSTPCDPDRPNGALTQLHTVCVTPDGTRVLSCGDDRSVHVWNLESGMKEHTLTGHKESVHALAVTPDSCRAVSGSGDKTLRVWNLATGKAEVKLEGHTNYVRSAVYSLDGSCIVSGSEDKTLRVWRLPKGTEERVLKGHSGAVWSLCLTNDGQSIVSGAQDGTVRVWSLGTGQQQRSISFDREFGGTERVFSVCTISDGRIAAGGDEGTVLVWHATGELDQRIKNCNVGRGGDDGHSNAVVALAATPDGQRLVSGSYDHTIRAWDISAGIDRGERQLFITSGSCGDDKERGHTDRVHSLQLLPDGATIASCGWDGTVRTWSPSGWQPSAAPAPAPPASSEQAMMSVQVPAGMQSGMQMDLLTPDGQSMRVTIPEGVAPLQSFSAAYAPRSAQVPAQAIMQVTVPDGVATGESILCESSNVSITTPDGQSMQVAVPPGCTAGQTFTVGYTPRA